MIDAMCAECRFFSSIILGSRPGWKCAKDMREGIEHDPTDQACDSFERKRGSTMLVRQEIPIPVKPTGRIDWQKPKGPIMTVEVFPQAPYWDGRTVWLRPDQLIWEDNSPISREELDAICLFERDVAAVMAALAMSGERIPLKVIRAASEGIVDAVRDMGLRINPPDLINPMKGAGRIGDLVSGVSAHSIISDLANAHALAKWGVAGFIKPKE